MMMIRTWIAAREHITRREGREAPAERLLRAIRAHRWFGRGYSEQHGGELLYSPMLNQADGDVSFMIGSPDRESNAVAFLTYEETAELTLHLLQLLHEISWGEEG